MTCQLCEGYRLTQAELWADNVRLRATLRDRIAQDTVPSAPDVEEPTDDESGGKCGMYPNCDECGDL